MGSSNRLSCSILARPRYSCAHLVSEAAAAVGPPLFHSWSGRPAKAPLA